MAYDENTLREASDRSGIPLGYLSRLLAAEEFDEQDPRGDTTLGKQLTVVFDHYVAKCLTAADPVAALKAMGFTETADAVRPDA
jgi:hypothetical protein